MTERLQAANLYYLKPIGNRVVWVKCRDSDIPISREDIGPLFNAVYDLLYPKATTNE